MRRGIPTKTGSSWSPQAVASILRRVKTYRPTNTIPDWRGLGVVDRTTRISVTRSGHAVLCATLSPVSCLLSHDLSRRGFGGQATAWNLSTTGWRLSGDLPLRIEEICSLSVALPTEAQVYVAAGIVRCARGEEFGIETLVMDWNHGWAYTPTLPNVLPISSHQMARSVVKLVNER